MKSALKPSFWNQLKPPLNLLQKYIFIMTIPPPLLFWNTFIVNVVDPLGSNIT